MTTAVEATAAREADGLGVDLLLIMSWGWVTPPGIRTWFWCVAANVLGLGGRKWCS
jgi:hypothetical protein